MTKTVGRYTITDNLAGWAENTDDDLSFYRHESKDNKYGEYFMVFNGVEDMDQDKDLNGTDWRVFMRLCKSLKESGWADKTQELLAQELNMYRPNVTAAIKKLLAKGYITRERHPKTGRLTLRIDVGIAGRGSFAIRAAKRALEKKAKGEMIQVGKPVKLSDILQTEKELTE